MNIKRRVRLWWKQLRCHHRFWLTDKQRRVATRGK